MLSDCNILFNVHYCYLNARCLNVRGDYCNMRFMGAMLQRPWTWMFCPHWLAQGVEGLVSCTYIKNGIFTSTCVCSSYVIFILLLVALPLGCYFETHIKWNKGAFLCLGERLCPLLLNRNLPLNVILCCPSIGSIYL